MGLYLGNNIEQPSTAAAFERIPARSESDWGLIRGRAICDMEGAHLVDHKNASSMLKGPSRKSQGGALGHVTMTQWPVRL